MPTTLTPGVVPNSAAALGAVLNATAPVAGDNRTAASVATPLQQLLNLIGIAAKLVNGGTIGANEALTVFINNALQTRTLEVLSTLDVVGTTFFEDHVTTDTGKNFTCGGAIGAATSISAGGALNGASCAVAGTMSANVAQAVTGIFTACAVSGAFTVGGGGSSVNISAPTTITGHTTIQSTSGCGIEFTTTPDMILRGFVHPAATTKITQRVSTVSINVDTGFNSDNADLMHVTNTAGGNLNVWALTPPAAGTGAYLKIKHKTGSANNLVVRDGSAVGTNLGTLAPGAWCEIVYDGTNWIILP